MQSIVVSEISRLSDAYRAFDTLRRLFETEEYGHLASVTFGPEPEARALRMTGTVDGAETETAARLLSANLPGIFVRYVRTTSGGGDVSLCRDGEIVSTRRIDPVVAAAMGGAAATSAANASGGVVLRGDELDACTELELRAHLMEL